MKQVLSLIAAVCLLAGAGHAVMVDDFQSYQPGGVEAVTTIWKGLAATSIIEADATDPGNMVLRGIQTGGQSSTYCVLPEAAWIGEGQTKTLFFRFRVNSNTTDTAMGLTDVDAPNTSDGQWDLFGPQIRFTNGAFGIRNGGAWANAYNFTLNIGETQPWYNLWMVVTNAVGTANDTFRVYVHQSGDDPATEANRMTVSSGTVSNFGFRNGKAATLDRFLWGRQSGGDATDVRRIWIDNVYVMDGIDLSNPSKNALGAHDPNPQNGAEGVEWDATLSWKTGVNPLNPSQVNPEITHHYFSLIPTEPNFLNPNRVNALIPVTGETGSFKPAEELLPDLTYYWKVDEVLNNQNPNDANYLIPGPLWSFKTVLSAPDVRVQPGITRVFAGEDAEITVGYLSFWPSKALWYKYVDGVNDTALTNDAGVVLNPTKYAVENNMTSLAKLIVKDAGVADQGYYYSVLENNVYLRDQSENGALSIKRLRAHWTLDGLVDGKYADETGNYPADPNGTPVFIAGANPAVSNQGVVIDRVNGFATAGTWNPSEYSNQFTISLWAKWAGQTTPATWQGLISKEVSYGADTMMWQYEVNQGTPYSVTLKNGMETGNLTSPVLPIDSWAHAAITWNGTTATLYRDGVQVASGAWQPGTLTDAPINIGISAFSSTTNLMFNGALDDIRIYNYAFDKYGVADLYHDVSGKGACIETTLYVAAYDLNGNCKIDLGDFAILASQWLQCGRHPIESCEE